MARKSKETILAEERAKQDEINSGIQAGIASALPGLIAQATAEIMKVVGQQGGGASPATADMQGFIRNMAVDLAKIADPKNERRTISPEMAAEREEGRQAMISLCMEAHRTYEDGGEPPIYVLTNKCFLDGVKYEPQQEDAVTHRMIDVEINWLRIPNQSMRPVNASAKAIHAAYLKSINNGIEQLPAPPPGPWVMTGNKIRRRGQFHEPPAVGNVESMPIRREEPMARQRREIPVLGTLAAPVVENM